MDSEKIEKKKESKKDLPKIEKKKESKKENQILDEFYTIEKLNEKTGFSDRYLRDNISNGSLKAFKRGRKWFVFHSDICDFLKCSNESD